MADSEDKAAQQKQEHLPLNFGKKLAHTDKVVRDRGFRILKKWLQKHAELERLDYLKLWKGLYFGFWMSDKRPVQQELAVNVALLINDIPSAKQGTWVDAFWEIMQASWEKLDRHRMSKYMLFLRIVVAEAFKVLRLGGWKAAEARALSETFTRGVPRHVKEGVNTPSIGMTLQFNRIFWDELQAQLGLAPAATEEAIMELLEPFCLIAEGSGLDGMVKNIHRYILLRVPPEYVSKLIFRLLSGAARKDIAKQNRQALYETVEAIERIPQAVQKTAAAATPAGAAAAGAPSDDGGAGGGGALAVADGAQEEEAQLPRRRKKRRPSSNAEGGEGGAAPAAAAGTAEAKQPPRKKTKTRRRKVAGGGV
mmetsp:Transcript_96969/g.269816  ORF Transcript_96969/g.269816 Transcript_96969/m.269816 type:complete len:366 (-) Transcript_96969:282-1379(-)